MPTKKADKAETETDPQKAQPPVNEPLDDRQPQQRRVPGFNDT